MKDTKKHFSLKKKIFSDSLQLPLVGNIVFQRLDNMPPGFPKVCIYLN